MAISQDRVIAIVSAGRNFRTAYETILNNLNTMRGLDPNSNIFQTRWASLLQSIIYPFPSIVSDAVTLDREYEHFRINARRNAKKAESLRGQRLVHGIMPRSKTPSTLEIYPPHQFQEPAYQPTQLTPAPALRDLTPEEQAELDAFDTKPVIDTRDPDFLDKILGRSLTRRTDTPFDGQNSASPLDPNKGPDTGDSK